MDGQTDGSLVYRVADGKLLASGDGVYFTALCPWSSTGVELHSGGGTVVTGVGTDDVLAVDSEEVRGLCAACFGEFPTYVALDGEYFSLTDMPLRSTAGCTMAPMRELAVWMGYYDFSYDAATGTAVCSNGAESITVRVGITQGQVSGRGPVSMAVPPELVGWHWSWASTGCWICWSGTCRSSFFTSSIRRGICCRSISPTGRNSSERKAIPGVT